MTLQALKGPAGPFRSPNSPVLICGLKRPIHDAPQMGFKSQRQRGFARKCAKLPLWNTVGYKTSEYSINKGIAVLQRWPFAYVDMIVF